MIPFLIQIRLRVPPGEADSPRPSLTGNALSLTRAEATLAPGAVSTDAHHLWRPGFVRTSSGCFSEALVTDQRGLVIYQKKNPVWFPGMAFICEIRFMLL